MNFLLKYPYPFSVYFFKCAGRKVAKFLLEFKRAFFESIILRALLILSGSIETNPGPTNGIKPRLSFAVWNLDSIPARNFSRLPLIESFQAVYDVDIFGVCESSLTNQISNDVIKLNGFSPEPFRSDKPDSTRNGGVCLYFKEGLPIKQRKDLQILNETIVAEISLKRKKMFFILSYRHPNQSADELENYIIKLGNIMDKAKSEKPACTVLTGDFNARSPLFWEGDIETWEGRAFSDFIISNCLEELMNEPTHIRDDGTQTCIDLLCTDQPYMFTETGVLPSLDVHSKHQIIFGKLNFQVPCPPPYKRKIWSYARANINQIRNEMSMKDWDIILRHKSVNQMAQLFSETFLDIMSRHVPNKIVTCNDRDAPWMNSEVKTAIKRNTRVYRKWVLRGRDPSTRDHIREVQNLTNKTIRQAKKNYFKQLGEKLSNPETGQKPFWTAFKRLLNKKKHSNIPPLMEGNQFVPNFKEKCSIFNNYFADQCKLHDNSSILPAPYKRTNSSLSRIEISEQQIIQIISKLNSNKAHGYDEISVAMLKLCPAEIAKPLNIIFCNCLSTGNFPDFWKFANVQPVYKKGDRQLKSNYRPISLLPICGKILEKIVFDSLYNYLINNDLISQDQSGFRPGDSTINQLLSITANIYDSFENYDETRAIFLDISKAFDKVWHDGLLFKLESNGISGNLLDFLKSYLSSRSQRVVLNGIYSNWMGMEAGVPQGSVLGPLLFLVYINDLTDNISSHMKLFADDSSLFARVTDVTDTQQKLENDLQVITEWAHQWKMVFNPDITKQAIEVIFSVKNNKPVHPELSFNGIPVARKEFVKHLGLYLDERLSFAKHVRESIIKAKKGIAILKFISSYVSRKVLDMTYKLYIRPHLDYGDIIYHNQRTDLMNLLEQVQYKAALIVSGCWQGTSREKLYDELGWESLANRRWYRRLSLFYKIVNGQAPSYLSEYIPNSKLLPYNLRKKADFQVPSTRTARYKNSFFPFCIFEWNKLDKETKSLPTMLQFQKHILNYIRPTRHFVFGIRDNFGVKLLTKLRVEFSDLRDHRYSHNFHCTSPLCRCGIEDETTTHYLLRCSLHLSHRNVLLSNVSDILHSNVQILPDIHLSQILLFGSNVYSNVANKLIIEETIKFIKSTDRFTILEAFAH